MAAEMGAAGLAYLFGLVLWLALLAGPFEGHPPRFEVGDWPLIHAYYNTLRDALTLPMLPLYMNFEHYSSRFLGLPETPLLPQYALVAFLDYHVFDILNLWLLHTVSFAGLLMLRRRFRLGLSAFLLLYVLVALNGYLITHVAIGHGMWYGQFFLPWVAYFSAQLALGPPRERHALGLAFTFALMQLHGSTHVLMPCLLFAGFLACFRPRALPWLAYTGVAFAALMAFRLLPGAVTLSGIDFGRAYGYVSLPQMVEAFTAVAFPVAIERLTYAFGWWEYSAYVGPLAFCFVVAYTLCARVRVGQGGRLRLASDRFDAYEWALLLVLILSFDTFYTLIHTLGVPFFTGQRVATRLVIVPLTGFALTACVRLQRHLERGPLDWRGPALVLALTALTTYSIWRFSS